MNLLLLLSLWLARAGEADGLDAVARGFFDRAAHAEQRQDWQEAEVGYRLVLERDPLHAASRVGLGEALELQGRHTAAEAVLRDALPDPEAFAVLVRLLVDSRRLDEALAMVQRWQDRDASDPRPWKEEARIRLLLGDAGLAWSRYRIFLEQGDPDEDFVISLVDALWEAGEQQLAEEVLTSVRWPGKVPEDVASRVQHWGWLSRARERMASGAEPLDADAAERVATLKRVLAGSSPSSDELLRRARVLASTHPRSPAVWSLLAEVHASRGDLDGAGEALATAVQLAPEDPDVLEAWGRHLQVAFGGRMAGEAADAFQAALRRDPFRVALHAARAHAAARARRWEEAREAALAYLQAAPRGDEAEAMGQLATAITRAIPEPAMLPGSGQACPEGIEASACEAFYLAQVLQDEGELQAALEQAENARGQSGTWRQAAHLEAQILWQLGRTETAMARWQAQLELRPADTLLLNLLARASLRLGRPDQARQYWMESAELGSALARLELARSAWEQGAWLEARRHLAAYESGLDGDDEEAAALRRRLDAWAVGLAAAVGGLVTLPVLWRRRRRSGADLQTLVSVAPRSAPEVARICAAIRHEVLKHRTTLLGALAEDLETSRHEHLVWAAEVLTGPDGATKRFAAYRDELVELGRRHGVRLNLAARDDTLGPLEEAMSRLDAMGGALRSGQAEPQRLRTLGQQLNVVGYRALGRLVRQLTVVEVAPEFVRDVFAQVRAEPGLRGLPAPELELDMPEPVPLRIYRSELRDILANLLRNALCALPREGEQRVGLAVRTEDDFITGLEEVLFRVRDTAQGHLTTAMVRGRYIERGLGLAVDLVSRNGGSVTVEPEPGWAKAVVVRLPRAERPEWDLEMGEAA